MPTGTSQCALAQILGKILFCLVTEKLFGIDYLGTEKLFGTYYLRVVAKGTYYIDNLCHLPL